MPKCICAHCEADQNLHQDETEQCPQGGREQAALMNKWADTKFLLKGSQNDLKGRIEALEDRLDSLERIVDQDMEKRRAY